MIRRVAVFRTEEHGRVVWSGYTRDFNTTWPSYVGTYQVEAPTWREAVRLAIEQAKKERGAEHHVREA